MKIKLIQNIIDKLRHLKKFNKIDEEFFELYLSLNAQKNSKSIDVNSFKGVTASEPYLLATDNAKILLPGVKFLQYCEESLFNSDCFFIWGTHFTPKKFSLAKRAYFMNKPVNILETGFFYSADTFANKNADKKYRSPVSFTIDSVTPYYDARYQSNLERLINDKNYIVTEEQKQRARRCIDKIVDTHLTKYNHQPIFEPNIGRKGVKKVLVVDQSYGDMSIAKGWGSDVTFKKMLECAINENPNADIIVKTHPDTMTGNKGGYYTGIKEHSNIYTQTEPINPISLIKYVDKVYVCTTQFGFEALMCGKEVHTFGMPFYAGWGLTQDYLNCDRRNNTRSLEEIFYLAYIVYSHYVNPATQKKCEIEEAMDYLLDLREEYMNLKKEAK